MKAILEFSGSYRFLSNFAPSPISGPLGLTFDTVEHAYQANKCVLTADVMRIFEASTPAKAKQLGRTVKLKPNWEAMKVPVMLMLLRKKFAKGTPLALKLLETDGLDLVEGNWWGDDFWGVPRGGEGKNMLGLLLMQVRGELQQ
jgi:ribA/ribD-fused uncharacterized protein